MLEARAANLLTLALAAAITVSGCAAGTTSPDPPAPQGTSANLLGMNAAGPLDWQKGRVYADVVRTARSFWKPNQVGAVRAAVDADGWPTEDFTLEVWADNDQMHGTYALRFEGQAASVPLFADLRYDAATNTTTGFLRFTATGPSALPLTMTGTRRTPQSALGSGVTKIRLMRPTAPGSAESYAFGTLFHAPLQNLLRKVAVVRWMDLSASNNNQQVEWADRALPSWATVTRWASGTTDTGPAEAPYGWEGIGVPWEHVVLYSNEIARDAWINVPAKATDDYVLKLAQLLRYGSDGVNPYTSPQANPVYPPLDPALRLYVEYSNEVWNFAGAFSVQSEFNRARALAEVSAGGSPLAFDGLADPGGYVYGWRRIAKRGVEVSRIFRGVFGDEAMMTRVRPVLMTQQGDGQGTFYQAARMLHGYYANGEGSFVAEPRPPGYYFYAAGGSGYYGPDNSDPTLTLESIWTSRTMSPGGWAPILRVDADWAAALGVKRVCYEGGPSMDWTGVGEAVKQAAWSDQRMTDAVVANHDAWSSFGGDVFVYYQAVGDYQWGFVNDVLQPGTPKMTALDALAKATRAGVTHGTAIPGSVPGAAFAATCRNWDRPGGGALAMSAGNANQQLAWASYTFRATGAGARRVTVQISSPNGSVQAYVDGRDLGRQAASAGTVTFDAGTLEPGLHGVIVRAAAGTFTADRVGIE